jgi:hypothetical protein
VQDLIRYLKDIVEPTIKDFEKNPSSVRHAFLACVATFHAVDYLAFPAKHRGWRQLCGGSGLGGASSDSPALR